MANILIIDDDMNVCSMLASMVKGLGHDAIFANTLKEGLNAVFTGSFDVVLLDVNMPDGSGLKLLPKIREIPSNPEVIIITAHGDPDGAEIAIKNGAWDYIQKPSSIKKMTLPLVRALQYRKEKQSERLPVILKHDGILGSSPQIKTCLHLIAQAACSDANVLITGDTGTGKELFAQAIHKNSRRADKNFVVVDCAALPDTLVESMLLGHEKGAFTGAEKSYEGLIKQADGGTLFLDEVGELPFSHQKVFLRVLQERRFRPVGGSKEVESDFHLVAATNQDLDGMIESNRFRKDLLFRLKSLTIKLPLLKDRSNDIKEIAMHRLGKLAERYGSGTKGFSPEFIEALNLYDWPGNVRELLNTIERAFVSANNDPTLFCRHLPTSIRVKLARASIAKKSPPKGEKKDRIDEIASLTSLREFRNRTLKELEKQYLRDLILLTNGDIQECCRISSVSRSRLYRLLKDHNISRTN
jgi:two-component system, NtrC family, response regulator